MASGHPQIPVARDGPRRDEKRDSAVPGTPRAAAVPHPASEERSGAAYDFDRLERAVTRLVAEQAAVRAENARLLADLEDMRVRVMELDALLEAERGRREEALGRVDELIARIEAIDPTLARESATPPPSEGQ